MYTHTGPWCSPAQALQVFGSTKVGMFPPILPKYWLFLFNRFVLRKSPRFPQAEAVLLTFFYPLLQSQSTAARDITGVRFSR